MACDARLGRALLLAVLGFLGCTTGDDLSTDPGGDGVPALALEVLGQHAIRLRWEPAPSMTLRLERRINLQGDFSAMGGDLPHAQSSLIDGALEPSTFYGYRLAGYDAFGKRVGTSTVVGGQTSPPPGIDLTITTEPADPPAVDPDGYGLTIAGPADTTRMPVDVRSHLLVSPLAPGSYRLTLDGLAQQCAPVDSLTRDVNVTDQGVETVQVISIAVSCLDPERGRATATIATRGDLPDPDGFQVTLDGVADDTSLPEGERAYHLTKEIGGAGGDVSFDNLRPGSYAFTVDGLAANCTLDGPQGERFAVGALGQVEEAFAIDCEDPGAAGRPFTLRSTWVPAQAPTGTPVAIELALDLSARAGQDLVAFTTETIVDTLVLRYDSTTGLDIATVVSNQPLHGDIIASGFVIGAGPSGVVRLARLWFTVVGDNGKTVTTQTKHSSMVGSDGAPLDPDIRTIEGTFTVGSGSAGGVGGGGGGDGGGGGGGPNQAPHASANGPYTGTAAQPVAFSAAGSADPDGTIASYAWTFGDGGTATGESPAHTYASAGSYTATLTVIDNLGSTASATAQVTIADAGGGGGGAGGGDPGTSALDWQSSFGPVDAGTRMVPLNLTLDLRSDPAVSLSSWQVTELTWDPAVLSYASTDFAGGSGVVDATDALTGRLRVSGRPAAAANAGLVTVAVVRFVAYAASGTTSATHVTLGAVTGTSSAGAVDLLPRVVVHDGGFVTP